MKPHISILLLPLTFLIAACSAPASEGEEADRPEARVAEVDLTIGVLEGEEPYMFGRVSGVTADDTGRIYVADGQANEIRAFDAEGQYLFTVAGPGQGPGEVDRPCCLTFDADGYLWVRDDQNRRYNRYHIDSDGATPDGQIGMDHTHFGLMTATTFDSEGNLVDVGGAFDEETQEQRRARIHRAPDDSLARTQYMPEPPSERIDEHRIETENAIVNFAAPYGSRAINAHGPGGDWAYAITDRYEVVRFNEEGDTLHVIERSVTGPRLLESERERAEEQIENITSRSDVRRSDLPFGVPDRKPPLSRLFFDAHGRLWVQRAVADGAPNEADVYDREGTLVDVVQWPSGVDLQLGLITDSVAYGIQSGGSDDVDRVVRLVY